MKKFKISSVDLSDGTTIYTIYFKKNTQERIQVKNYLESINAIEICTTFLENGIVYINYIGGKENE